MIKKVLLYGLLLFFVAFVGSQIAKFYIDNTTPDFLNEIVSNTRDNQKLMDEIGGYKSYKYTYNENDLSTDTLAFEIIIHGNSKQLEYTGYAVKVNNEWEVKDMKDSVE